MSSNGFTTSVWGAPAWLFLHCIAFNYSPERKLGYKLFFKYLAEVLPCGACRNNYKRLITSNTKYRLSDKVFKNRYTFSYYLFILHNKIQQDIYEKSKTECNKPMYRSSKDDFRKVKTFYEMFRSKCYKNAYGCTVPKRGLKLRSRVLIGKYNKRCSSQKNGIVVL